MRKDMPMWRMWYVQTKRDNELLRQRQILKSGNYGNIASMAKTQIPPNNLPRNPRRRRKLGQEAIRPLARPLRRSRTATEYAFVVMCDGT